MPFRAFSFRCRLLQLHAESAVRPPAGCARRGGCIPGIQTQGFSFCGVAIAEMRKMHVHARDHASDYHYAHYCACAGSSLARTPTSCASHRLSLFCAKAAPKHPSRLARAKADHQRPCNHVLAPLPNCLIHQLLIFDYFLVSKIFLSLFYQSGSFF